MELLKRSATSIDIPGRAAARPKRTRARGEVSEQSGWKAKRNTRKRKRVRAE